MMVSMRRFLEIYWIIYFLAYPVGVGLLLWHFWGELAGGDDLARIYLLGAIFSAAAGASAIFAMIVEAGGYAVLLIPDRIRKLRNEGIEIGLKRGREEGRVEGREEGRVEGREEGIEEGREEGRVEGRVEGREEGREEGIQQASEEKDKRLKEAGERFGYMENGERVLRFTAEVERFMAGEDVAPPPPAPPPAPPPPQTYSRRARRKR